MLRYILTFCGVALLLATASTVRAALVDYTMSYDPTTNSTILTNGLDSAADLEFWTRSGPDLGTPLALVPGGTAIIDSSGNVTARWWEVWLWGTDPLPEQYHNKKVPIPGGKPYIPGDLPFTITGPGPVHITIDSWYGYKEAKPLQYGYPGNYPYIDAKGNPYIPKGADDITICTPTNTTCSITPDAAFTIGPSTSVVYISDDWPGVAGQTNLELQYGTVESVDNTDSFTSVFNCEVGTGCIPEPASLVAWATLGAMGLIVCAWRRRKAKLHTQPTRPDVA